MERELIPSATPLADLCRLLGISAADLASVEEAEVLAHSFHVDGQHVAQLDVPTVRSFVNHYGPAATIELRTGDLTELVLGVDLRDDELAALTASAASAGPYEADVHVDKGLLIERLAGGSPVRGVRVFLFAESLRRSLERGISWFETYVWTMAPAPLVIAVLDCEIQLVGDHLAILGGSSLGAVSDLAASPAVSHHFDQIITSRDHHIGWDRAWTDHLTPWHFELAGTCADTTLLALVRAQLVKLAILFTCDRARARHVATPPDEILAEYRGRDHVAIVPIDERTGLDASDAELKAVLQAVGWCYERHGGDTPDWVSDRLLFLQTRVAQSLEPQPAGERLTALTRSMPYLLEGVEWHWKAFIEGKVGEYLDRLQQVESIVSDTVTAFADRTAGLTTGLSQNMLAAVAVLIGSFIAAAFDTPFNATLFRVGVLTYAGYVVIFPGAIGLVSSTTGLLNARSEFNARVRRFNEILYPEKVNEVVGSRISAAECSYYRWLTFVAFAYVIVAVAAVVAAATVPHLVQHPISVRGHGS